MTARQERVFFRTLHMVLSIPILGYIYGPVAHIPQATWFTRWVAMPLVVLSGLWLWLKPRLVVKNGKIATNDEMSKAGQRNAMKYNSSIISTISQVNTTSQRAQKLYTLIQTCNKGIKIFGHI